MLDHFMPSMALDSGKLAMGEGIGVCTDKFARNDPAIGRNDDACAR